MSRTTTVAELSVSLNHVQSLLKQITAEVKVLSEGIAVLVELEEQGDLEAELDYLDVDPWSNVNDKEKNNSVTGASSSTRRQDSVRSLLQRKPSTVKDETKALARILSQKRTSLAGSGNEAESKNSQGHQQQQQQQPQPQHSQPAVGSAWPTSNLQEQVIEEDSASSEGSNSFQGGQRHSDSFSSTPDKHDAGTPNMDTNSTYTTIQALNIASVPSTASASSTLRIVEAERVPHTISVQTAHIPKYSLAISKPSATPVLSTSSSQGSILGGFGTSASSNNISTLASASSPPSSSSAAPPPYFRSQTTPNMDHNNTNTRPSSVAGNIIVSGEPSSRNGSAANTVRGRPQSSDPRSSSDNQMSSSIKDRYSALRSASQGTILHPTVGRDTLKSTVTVNKPPSPMSSSHGEKIESADCFSKLGLKPELLRGIYAYGLEMPSMLQQRGIPMIMTRQDVLIQAKPEVAKTLTYAIPLLHFLTLPATSIHPQLIILCSNHDLCQHVQRVLLALARFMPTISCLVCAEGSNATLSLGTISTTQVNVAGHGPHGSRGQGFGGTSKSGSMMQEPLPYIAAHVVIGTPGKVLNLVRTKQLSLSALKVMVLENADILLVSPLKEATVSLLSMIRDTTLMSPTAASTLITTTGSASSTSVPTLSSPPNSGPTSPVSMAVAALNGRAMANSNGTNIGRFPGSDGSIGNFNGRPRSMSIATLPPLSGPATSSSANSAPPPQLLLFSTLVPSYVLEYVNQYSIQPTKALVKGHDQALKGILQFFKYLTVDDEDWRLDTLCDMLEESGAHRTVVFCNNDESVERVVRRIRERKGTAIGVYTEMDMAGKKSALAWFKSANPSAFFVLSDEAAKDLEIVHVPLVISFEVPSISYYIPRVKWIDRSGGRVGVKVTLVDGQRGEVQALKAIQQHYRAIIDEIPPSIAEFIVN
ncbi:Eukaryotic initiation factor 4A-III [Gryganskiella cystojenkinii]|nr:Eukaryotic initiation factor 4A-III [Gryganskiella cystojenkinii]